LVTQVARSNLGCRFSVGLKQRSVNRTAVTQASQPRAVAAIMQAARASREKYRLFNNLPAAAAS
jgi:hypothetical protein